MKSGHGTLICLSAHQLASHLCIHLAEAQNGVLRMALQQEVPSHMFTLPRVWEQVRSSRQPPLSAG